MKQKLKKIVICILAVSLCIHIVPTQFVKAETVQNTYPIQEFRIGIGNTDRNINISGYAENSPLNSWVTNGEQNEKWYLNYISEGIYEIVNSTTRKLITADGNICILAEDTDAKKQRWKIIGTDKDFNGQYLYYKIVSAEDETQAVTFEPKGNKVKLSAYTDSNYQKFKLNCDGLEGFAANCVVTEGEKAGTIGGLLGETVFVDTLEKMKTALVENRPLTIVVTEDIDCSGENYDWRIEDDKTIVGSYGNRQLRDCKLRTNDYWGKEKPSDNIIIRNIKIQIEVNKNIMALAVYSSKNIWIDHCTFHCEFDKEYDEVGKFIWINTPYEGTDVSRSPDFVTISYNIFSNRYWGIAFGTQNTCLDENRASMMYNTFDSIVNRAPQMGNGTLHVYNNYYVRKNTSIYEDGMNQIKCGEGGKVNSQANRFENFKKESSGYWDKEVEVYDGSVFYDEGSWTNKTENGTGEPYLLEVELTDDKKWNPSEINYGYKIIPAYDSENGMDIKKFCLCYAGCFNSYEKIQYITNRIMSAYVAESIASPIGERIEISVDEPEDDSAADNSTSGKNDIIADNINQNANNITDISDQGSSSINDDTSAEQAAKEAAQTGTIAIEEIQKIITSVNTDKGDVSGSTFAALKLKAKGGNKSVKLSWSKVNGADGYIIYGAACGKQMEAITEIAASKKSYIVKKLAKGKYYKYMVVAYKNIYGEKCTINTSVTVHIATKGGKFGNPTAITYSKKKISLKTGSTFTLKPKLQLNSKVKTHIAKFRYESLNPAVAMVNKKGKIKGNSKGSCYVYMYTQNGLYKKVKVIIK